MQILQYRTGVNGHLIADCMALGHRRYRIPHAYTIEEDFFKTPLKELLLLDVLNALIDHIKEDVSDCSRRQKKKKKCKRNEE
ncbi:hypothetical protein EVAR_64905_1 [Eumeta japonica]|uniref:Uncharacterized protein n=1 Tax=Eumeta variegata TaxID=151549 RepID=A0A4C2A0C1_EUMVA|nr:hypothetical protein EVAR_64905_1 [Eumeta japonica]